MDYDKCSHLFGTVLAQTNSELIYETFSEYTHYFCISRKKKTTMIEIRVLWIENGLKWLDIPHRAIITYQKISNFFICCQMKFKLYKDGDILPTQCLRASYTTILHFPRHMFEIVLNQLKPCASILELISFQTNFSFICIHENLSDFFICIQILRIY